MILTPGNMKARLVSDHLKSESLVIILSGDQDSNLTTDQVQNNSDRQAKDAIDVRPASQLFLRLPKPLASFLKSDIMAYFLVLSIRQLVSLFENVIVMESTYMSSISSVVSSPAGMARSRRRRTPDTEYIIIRSGRRPTRMVSGMARVMAQQPTTPNVAT